MRVYVRFILAVMLAAVAAVGSARGDEEWKKYNDGTITWLYQMVDGNSCRIKPASYRFGTQPLTIPSGVEDGGRSIGVVEIADAAFYDCKALTSVVIPEGVTTIGDRAFEFCVNLREVLIPEGVTTIEIGIFWGCSGLTKVTIPSSVTTITGGDFAGCSGLQRIDVVPGNPRYYSEEGVLYGTEHDPKSGKEVKALICCPAGRIGGYRIPGDVEIIGVRAFSGCSGLTSVTIPAGVTAIGGGAFRGCSGLMSVTIPSSVATIGYRAFKGCSGLTKVTIPSSVTKIEGEAFKGCSGLERIEVASGNPRYHDEDGVLFGFVKDHERGVDVKALMCYPAGRVGEYRIPADVEKVEWGAFSGCSKLTKVTFPGRIELGKFNLFDDCIALEEIVVEFDEKGRYYTKDGVLFSTYTAYGSKSERTYETTLVRCPLGKRGAYEIPTGVEVIGWDAFAGCSQLTDIAIPTGVRDIRAGAFTACGGLTRLVLPATVSDVFGFPFGGCSRLEEFVVDAASPYYRTEGGALLSRDGRMLICYPEGRKGAYEIPQGVTDLGEGEGFCCFSPNLTSLVVPSSLKEISGIVGCENLKEVYWLASADMSDGDDGFYDLPLGATLYVRPGEKPKVEAEEWAKRFSKIVEGHVVTFRDADGQPVGEQLVKPNGKARALDMQDKNGNAVVWLLNGAPYDFDLPVRGDLVLQAGGSSTAVESALLAGVQAVSNPVVDVLELRGMGNAARVEVYSVAGVQVHAGALRGEDRVQVDARGWASGVYVVRVVAHDGAKTLRVVKRD